MKLAVFLLSLVVPVESGSSTIIGLEHGGIRGNKNRKLDESIDEPLFYLEEDDTTLLSADGDELFSGSETTFSVESYFTQPLDHFDFLNNSTYQQRFLYSDYHEIQNAEKKVTLLMVGGEGGLMNNDHATWMHPENFTEAIESRTLFADALDFAKDMNSKGYSVPIFSLEHRYYGLSNPDFGDESPYETKNLKYLSSQQALADLANFISTVTDVNAPLITVGASYPGSLSAWARLKYPHLVDAALSDSGPLKAQINFTGYNDHIATSWANTDAGGSPECLEIVQAAHAEFGQAAQDLSRQSEVAEISGVCNVIDLTEKDQWAAVSGNSGSLLQFSMQSNDLTCTTDLCNLDKLCKALIEARSQLNDDLQALLEVRAQQGIPLNNATECIDGEGKWEEKTAMYYNTEVTGEFLQLFRPWAWQTCTEFGWVTAMPCEIGTNCPFARGYWPVEANYAICEEVFGILPEKLDQAMAATERTYGGWDLDGTRILSVEGAVDPWTSAALPEEMATKERPVMIVPGASHHEWTKGTDAEPLLVARKAIVETLVEWMEQIEEEGKYW